jgi:acetoin utilization deacetylase AcuC-like enzyme
MIIAYISHPSCSRHEMGASHPESPLRLSAIEDRLIETGFDFALRHHDAPAVSREQLERVHDPDYVEHIFRQAPTHGLRRIDEDTAMNPHTLEAALHAAGSVAMAVDLLIAGEVGSAFCGVRPPGHHAERARSMGFCFFNNVAVGAAHAMAAHGLKRVAIVDFDVHHGNGTEDIFFNDSRVLFCSSFQYPFYPQTDLSHTNEHIIKTPLQAGDKGQHFREAIMQSWIPALDAFKPELVLISAGFDGHAQDDMSHLRLTDDDYAWVTRKIKAIADAHAGGRVISVLEGGYDLPSLARSVATHLSVLLD